MRTLILLLVTVLGIGILAGAYIVTTGVSARTQPSQIEALTARTVRGMAIRFRVGGLTDPVSVTDATIAEGMEHFADHCAICHANDGSGDTEMGRALYPRVPDMRKAATQELSDGELFYIIENGVRLTGMPAWAHDSPDDGWKLVHFIRHQPKLTPAELEKMKSLNPKAPDDEPEKPDGAAPAPKPAHTHKHGA